MPDVERYPKLHELREKLYHAAKADQNRRFYTLKDKVYREDVLRCSWESVKYNKGSPGIDAQTINHVIEYGEDRFLNELAEDIRTETYRVKDIKRVYIPKKNGKQRPLGIPVIRDRIVQGAVKLVIEPIFEADFQEFSYGFREGRSTQDARKEIQKLLNWGCTNIYDADIRGYFDSIDHGILMELVERRIADGYILKLIRAWLRAGIIEDDIRIEPVKGTPQGGVISPLLANIYLNEMDRLWKKSGIEKREDARLIRYCDDFIVLSSRPFRKAIPFIEAMLNNLNLELSTEKTRITTAKEGFDFLGFHFFRKYVHSYNKEHTYVRPTKQSLKSAKTRIDSIAQGAINGDIEETVKSLNLLMRGWSNYYRDIEAYKTLEKVQNYALNRLRKYLRKRHTKSGFGYKEYDSEYMRKIGFKPIVTRR
ncbi:MAG: group II intron reverse transcriptase/maturase [Candidatus Thermoplasmatota archaeon]|nr:group II intron reverse transcriptase/maturase [Candidatus Thermoplasmatota archaeon]MDA8143265.1 group II intron reverse transcriptase/maturase [Thermoplasmatales archaeon]